MVGSTVRVSGDGGCGVSGEIDRSFGVGDTTSAVERLPTLGTALQPTQSKPIASTRKDMDDADRWAVMAVLSQ